MVWRAEMGGHRRHMSSLKAKVNKRCFTNATRWHHPFLFLIRPNCGKLTWAESRECRLVCCSSVGTLS